MLFNYTTELRNYFEHIAPEQRSHSEKIEEGRTKLFDFHYPIFDEDYRKVFETHFIRRYYMRQIGFETFGMFKFQLETWLIVNMPYWNKMFESELLKYDPLTNSKMNVSHKKSNNKIQDEKRNGNTSSSSSRQGTSSVNGTSEATQTNNQTGVITDDNFDRKLESNTPDGRLNLAAVDGEGIIEYASNIKENNENNKRNTSLLGTETNNQTSNVNGSSTDTLNDNTALSLVQESKVNDIEDFILNRTGKVGVQSFSKLVQDYRQSLLRIENMIFKEMDELFMLVY